MKPRDTWRFILPGLKPPDHVVRLLALLHPSVALAWDSKIHRWRLIERGLKDGRWQPVAILEDENGDYERPTLSNTVHLLNEIDVRNAWHWDRTAGIDEHNEAIDAEADRRFDDVHQGAVREVAAALRHAHGERRSVAMRPSKGT